MLILASRSPIRKALLAGAGIGFEAKSADVNERAIEAAAARENASPAEIAQRLAEAKALAVGGAAVIGADQVLELDGTILHKPDDAEAARRRLDVLRGRTHLLHSGIAVAVDGVLVWSGVETSRLTMRAFPDAERDAYLLAEGDAALGSVGAYLYEGRGIRLFERVEGDYASILGLPLLPLLAALRRHVPDVLKGFT
ncbi:MAG TPA: Maf family protein [Devosia sp.]|nr:Maf family protein [Devosia sp.]